MDLRHMRHFVAVAEELHFGRAACRLNMAQPPVSQSIRRLEDDLGVTLFDRSRRGVALTEAGHVFLAEARRTLMQAELARKMARRAVAGAAEVRISFVVAALYSFLPPLIVRMHRTMPDVRLTLTDAISREQMNGLLAGENDIGFVLGETEDSEGFDRLVVQRSLYALAVPASWPIASRPSITLKEAAALPFVQPPTRSLKHLQRMPNMLAIFESVGALPHVVQEASQSSVVLGLVGAGLGCSIITAAAANRRPPDVRFLPISDHPSQRRWELVMLWNRDRLSPSATVFVDEAKAYVADNPDLLDLCWPASGIAA